LLNGPIADLPPAEVLKGAVEDRMLLAQGLRVPAVQVRLA
jgi:hypothetical protein